MTASILKQVAGKEEKFNSDSKHLQNSFHKSKYKSIKNLKVCSNSHELLLEANFHIQRSMLLFKTTGYTVKQEQIIFNWTCCNS